MVMMVSEIVDEILQLAAAVAQQKGRTRRIMIIGGKVVVLPRRDHHHGDGAGQVVLPATTMSRYSDH